jgi:hypothetical protein
MRDCPRCCGDRVVRTWLPRLRLSDGFLQFMRAGGTLKHDNDGNAWDEIVCPQCNGTGQVPDDFPPDAADLRDPDEELEPIEE